MTIREIQVRELPLVSDLHKDAFAEGLIREYIPDALEYHWQKLMEAGIGTIFASGSDTFLDGAIGVVVEPDLYTGQTQAREAAFFIRPNRRGGVLAHQLMDRYDEWAQGKGAIRQFITAHWGPNRDRLEKMYRRRGYVATDVCYGKDVEYEAVEKAS